MIRVIPVHWLPPAAKCSRVIVHWTAGTYLVTDTDRQHYHAILQDQEQLGAGKDVLPFRGVYSIRDNESTTDGRYAAHCRGLNTCSFGLAVACMDGAVQGGPYGHHPLTGLLFERAAQAAAEVLTTYSLPVTERTCLMHSEVERVYGKQQAGKWDIDVLPWEPQMPAAEVHSLFRRKVAWYAARHSGE